MDKLEEQMRSQRDVWNTLYEMAGNEMDKCHVMIREYASRGTDGISKKVPDENTPRGTKVIAWDVYKEDAALGIFIDIQDEFNVLCDQDNEVTSWKFCEIED